MLQKGGDGNVLVHHNCRWKFVDTQKAQKFEIPKKRLRSSKENIFDWKMNYFLCPKKAIKKYSTFA